MKREQKFWKAISLAALIALVGCASYELLVAETGTHQFTPKIVGQSANFTTVEAGLTAGLAETAASPFMSETGIIQIAINRTSGSATAGVITVYTRLEDGDTVFVAVPSATFSLITAASKVSGRLNVGPGYHKLVVTDQAGTYNFDLMVRDF